MKHKISIIVAALLIFVLALGITLYPLISNYVNQKYASTIYTKYEEMIRNVDENLSIVGSSTLSAGLV